MRLLDSIIQTKGTSLDGIRKGYGHRVENAIDTWQSFQYLHRKDIRLITYMRELYRRCQVYLCIQRLQHPGGVGSTFNGSARRMDERTREKESGRMVKH